MQNALDVTIDSEFWKCMVVGDYGTGKSIFASTFPTKGFIFDFGGGILSYRGRNFDYEQYPVSHLGWIKFEKDLVLVKKAVIEEKKYITVIVDDTTSMVDLAMQQALALDPKRSSTSGPVWNIHFMMVRNLIEGRLRQIIDLPANIVVISHLTIERDEETGSIISVNPLLTGQLAIKVPGYFDEVYYASTRRVGQKTEWVMQTIPVGFYKARSRVSGKERLLPDYIPNDYNEIVKILKTKSVAKTTTTKAT